MSIKQDIIRLAHDLEEERNEAFMLWTWLPSHKVVEKHHGDHGDNFTPSVSDILKEATLWLAYINSKKDNPDAPMSDEQKQWFTECPCGEACERKVVE